MNPSSSPSDTAAVIGALGTLGIESYQLSQGQNVSTSLIGGVPVIQSGAAATQSTVFLVVLGIGLLAVVAWFFLR